MAWTKKLNAAAIHGFDPVRGAAQLLHLVLLWHHRARSRRALARLDTRLLRDIGIDRLDAAEEARKPFWRA